MFVTLTEHSLLHCVDDDLIQPKAGRIGATLYQRLKRLDLAQRDSTQRVFSWGDGWAKATRWVGVLQVPGLTVEILPKADRGLVPGGWAEGQEDGSLEDAGGAFASGGVGQLRSNLLYMLAVGGMVPVSPKDVASLASQNCPLNEALARVFAKRLLSELLTGPHRTYLARQENLYRFKGKLLVTGQIRHNLAHNERFFCGFDEFTEDNTLNRILRAACRRLVLVTRTPATHQVLQNCLAMLDEVADILPGRADFEGLDLTRQNLRFEALLGFARLLFLHHSPSIEAGHVRTFSLLFDMEKVFEQFVAGFLSDHVLCDTDSGGVAMPQLFAQHGRTTQYLLQEDTPTGSGFYRMKPDLFLEWPLSGAPEDAPAWPAAAAPPPRAIMDTKWKLSADGITGADLYQMYAYSREYNTAATYLLYPDHHGAQEENWRIPTAPLHHIRTRTLPLHGDLRSEVGHQALRTKLRQIVMEAAEPRGMG